MSIQNCPFCKSKRLEEEKQPYPGTHAFSILYECGTETIHTISDSSGDIADFNRTNNCYRDGSPIDK